MLKKIVVMMITVAMMFNVVAFAAEEKVFVGGTLESVYQTLKSNAKDVTLTNVSNSDITCFWDILAYYSIEEAKDVRIDYSVLSYAEMNAQRLAKVMITMVSCGVDVTTKVYHDMSVVDLMKSYQQEDGSFNNILLVNKDGDPIPTQATEQVWCIIAMEIVDATYDRDKGLEYLFSCQNEDGGLGYGSWSDLGTTSWALNAASLSGFTGESIDRAVNYCKNQWELLRSSNDSSSMSAFISSGYATENQLSEFLETSYVDGYFTWGDSDAENAYATSTGIQAIGDSVNGSVYARLDEACVIEESTTPPSLEPTTPPAEEPTIPPSGERPNPPFVPTENEVSHKVSIDVPGLKKTVAIKVEEGSSVYTVVTKALDELGIAYNAQNEYISSVVVNGKTIGYGYAGNGLDGLMYKVNNKSPEVGMGQYILKKNDKVKFYYTKDYTKEDTDFENYPHRGSNSSSSHDVEKPVEKEPEQKVEETKSHKFKLAVHIPAEPSIDRSKFDGLTDVKDHWSAAGIEYCSTRGYMTGFGDGRFAPDETLTRGQFVQIVYNIFGENKTLESVVFSDVEKRDWYYEAVCWASQLGIVTGVGDGRFAPDEVLSRQDMAVLLNRIFGLEGENVKYSDDGKIDDYAKSSVYALTSGGYITGIGDNAYNPQGVTTRGQCAVVVMRLISDLYILAVSEVN